MMMMIMMRHCLLNRQKTCQLGLLFQQLIPKLPWCQSCSGLSIRALTGCCSSRSRSRRRAAPLSAGTSEPMKDGDIWMSELSSPGTCCSACVTGHEEVHARLAAWQAVGAIVVVRVWNKDESINCRYTYSMSVWEARVQTGTPYTFFSFCLFSRLTLALKLHCNFI